MEDLIKALTIFSKYSDTRWPTNCSHDVFAIMEVGEDDPTEDEKVQLEKLDFMWSEEDEVWMSFRFGSA